MRQYQQSTTVTYCKSFTPADQCRKSGITSLEVSLGETSRGEDPIQLALAASSLSGPRVVSNCLALFPPTVLSDLKPLGCALIHTTFLLQPHLLGSSSTVASSTVLYAVSSEQQQ